MRDRHVIYTIDLRSHILTTQEGIEPSSSERQSGILAIKLQGHIIITDSLLSYISTNQSSMLQFTPPYLQSTHIIYSA